MPPTKIDVGAIARELGAQVSITPEENQEDRSARITRENNAAKLANFKEYMIFIIVYLFFSVVLMICLYIIFDNQSSLERRRWAENVFSVIASGGVSYLLGRKVGK